MARVAGILKRFKFEDDGNMLRIYLWGGNLCGKLHKSKFVNVYLSGTGPLDRDQQ